MNLHCPFYKAPKSLFLVTFVLLSISHNNLISQTKPITILKKTSLEDTFKEIPDSIQTSVYWYWVSGNISHSGVVKDLEAMKKVGINRAFIANVTWGEANAGEVKMFSSDWWDILHTAFKTATKLGIEIGMFNCPGWSQSGGPWVKPEQSMRYLTASENVFKGPCKINQKLQQPASFFQDVKVIAYPAPREYLSDLLDSMATKSIILKNTTTDTVDINIDSQRTVRSILFCTTMPLKVEGDIYIKDNATYRPIKHFTIDRTSPNIRNGFIPYGPAVVGLPKFKSERIRIIFQKHDIVDAQIKVKLASTPFLENYIEKTLAKMSTDGLPQWSAYQWKEQPIQNDLSQYVDPKKVIDVSAYMSANGTFNWNVPEGNWVVERVGMTSTLVQNVHATPESTGLETDKLSAIHIASHFNSFMGEIMRRIPAADRRCWKTVVIDSYETGSQNWTDSFIDIFKLKYKYDPLPYLPVLQGKIVGSPNVSDRFLWDLRRLIAARLAYSYMGGLTSLSHKYGLSTWLENYGHYGFPGEFLQYGGQADEVSGEFWNEGKKGYLENRAAASSAHIYGKNKISAESFTTTENYFQNSPATLKRRLDQSFTEGINNTLLHVYIQQKDNNDLPGLNAYFGSEFNRKNTWFFEMNDFIKYIKRCNFMLQQGKYVADVAYFIGEDAPKMTGIQDPVLPTGYSFDFINGEILNDKVTVENGSLQLPDGMRYRVLVLPKLNTMLPATLKKIQQLVQQGAIVLGVPPSRSPSLENFPVADQQVRALSNSIWKKRNGSFIRARHLGKGMVLSNMSLTEVFKFLKLAPDFQSDDADSLAFIHRRLAQGSIYFISNQSNSLKSSTIKLRISKKLPFSWNPVTGSITPITEYKSDGQTTVMQLKLAPHESTFIGLFGSQNKSTPKTEGNISLRRSIDLSRNWTIQFDKEAGGPSKPIEFLKLNDWSKCQNDSIRYYSGSAIYTKDFLLGSLKKGDQIHLNLGNLNATAKVWINGVDIGTLWTEPYSIDISAHANKGKNTLKIKIVNNWINRILGDTVSSEDEKYTKLYYHFNTQKIHLQPSGLFGPVKIQIIK